MKLHCRSCDTHFEVEEGAKPRCPNCLRSLGLELQDQARPAATPPRGPRGLWLSLGIMVGALALAGVVVAVVLATRGPASSADGTTAEPTPRDPVEAARQRGEALRLVEEGRQLLKTGKLPEANRKADEALRLAPTTAEVRQLRGEIYRSSGGLQEAVGEFVAALSAQENTERHLLAAETLAALGELTRAEQHFQRARQLEPGAPGPVVGLALLYRATAREEELARLRSELQGGADGGSSPLLVAVEEALQKMEEARRQQLEALQQQLAERSRAAAATNGPGGGSGPATGAPPDPVSGPTPDAGALPAASP